MIRLNRKAAHALRASGLVAGLALATLAGIGAATALNPAPAARSLEASVGPAPLNAAAKPVQNTATVQPAPAKAEPAAPATRKPVRVVNIHGHDAGCVIVEIKRGADGQSGPSRCMRKQ